MTGQKLEMDDDLQRVLEFMRNTIPANKLVSVAEKLPHVARLLWSQFQQEPCNAISLVVPKTVEGNQSQPVSIESSPVMAYGHDDSAGAEISR